MIHLKNGEFSGENSPESDRAHTWTQVRIQVNTKAALASWELGKNA